MRSGWVSALASRGRSLGLVPLVLAFGMIAFGYQARMGLADQAGPYCRHLDEHLWTKQAIRILKTGDLNPHRFTKPSVMVYLDTASFALGYLKIGMSGENLPPLEELREGGYPYYTNPKVVRMARQVYALLSLGALAMAALLARHLMKKLDEAAPPRSEAQAARGEAWVSRPDAVGLSAFGVGLLSEFYLRYSHLYLGVDILGCFFALLAISYFVMAPATTRPPTFAIVAGILGGLCLGTKYNLYPIVAPALLAIAFRHRDRLLSSSVLFFLALGVTFLVTTPYALLDLPSFVSSAAAEARHYARGHSGHDTTPGLSTFLDYGKPVLVSYGLGFVLLALGGLWGLFRKVPKETALIVLYPLLLWIYMSGQRVIFTRNLLILQLMLPIFAVLGVLVAAALLRDLAQKRGLEERFQGFALPLVLSLALLVVPWSKVIEGYEGPGESRVELADWLSQRSERVILMPNEAEFDPRTVEDKELVSYDARGTRISDLRGRNGDVLIVAPVFEKGHKTLKGDLGELLWSGGKNRVRLDVEYFSGSRVSSGNPKLVVYGAREK